MAGLVQLHDQVARVDLKRLGDTDDVVQRDVPLTAFNLPEVGPVQFAEVCEGLLTQTEVVTPLANTRPELGSCRGEGRLAWRSGHAPTPSVP